MRDVEKEIEEKLEEIEQKEQVRILYAVESGSRAWGFASPDSDYDVRFVYVRPQEAYLRLEGVRDVIEWQREDAACKGMIHRVERMGFEESFDTVSKRKCHIV